MSGRLSHQMPEPAPFTGCVTSEKPQPPTVQDLQAIQVPKPESRRRYPFGHRGNMPALRQCCLAVIIVAFLTVAYASAPSHQRPSRFPRPPEEDDFQGLLSSVSDDALHEVLHDVSDKYRHGAYPGDRKALQAVHEDSPAVATSLIELAKRQNSSNPITSGEVPTISITVEVPSTSTVIITPSPTETVTMTSTSTAPVDTSLLPVSTSSTLRPSTSPSNLSSSATSASRSPSSATSSSSPPASSTTTSPPVTSKVSTTIQRVFTTTLSNGVQSTVTSFTVVEATQPTAPGAAGSSSTGTPSLQNGAVYGREPRGAGLVGCFVAALIFVMGVL